MVYSSANSHGEIQTCNIFMLFKVSYFANKLHLIRLIKVWALEGPFSVR